MYEENYLKFRIVPHFLNGAGFKNKPSSSLGMKVKFKDTKRKSNFTS